MDKFKKFKELVNTEVKKGNIVFMTVEGPASANVDEFIKQPIEGILYDLNRDEAVVTSFIEDPKWVNDYAVCKVIRKLKEHYDKNIKAEKPESAYKKIWKKFGVFIENCKANKGEATTALLCLLIAKHRVLEKELKKE